MNIGIHKVFRKICTTICCFRLVLRCRQWARTRFAKLRADVLVKMELLDNKHLQSLGGHLVNIVRGFSEFHSKTLEIFAGPALFPVEVDLSSSAFQYKSTIPQAQVTCFLYLYYINTHNVASNTMKVS